jgi:hypothetical protein
MKNPQKGRSGSITIPDPIIVRDLAAALKVKPFKVVDGLMDFEVFATPDSKVDFLTASALCLRHGIVARKVI